MLVNNAGMSLLYADVTDVTEAMWDKVVDLNLKGVFRLTALVGSRMVRDGGGSIINVSSVGSIRPTPEILPYAAAKAGVNSLDRRVRPAPSGPTVRVNCIMAGPFLTDVTKAWDMEAFDARRAAPRPAARRRARRGGGYGAVLRQRRVELHHRTAPARRRRHPLTQLAPESTVFGTRLKSHGRVCPGERLEALEQGELTGEELGARLGQGEPRRLVDLGEAAALA